jgi:hypothetical protein
MAKRGEQARRITPCDRRRGRAGDEKRSDQGLVPDRLLYPETWVVTLDGQVSIWGAHRARRRQLVGMGRDWPVAYGAACVRIA